MKRSNIVSAALFAIASLAAATAVAQDAVFSTLPMLNSHNELVSEELRRNFPAQTARTTARAAGAAARPSASGSGRADYRPSSGVTRRVEDQFLAHVQRSAPADADTIQADLARFDPVDAWSPLVRSDGFRTGDVGHSLASYWILNWLIANNVTTDSPDDAAKAAAVRQQVGAVFASSPSFSTLDDAGRQEMSESLMLNFVYQQKAYVEAVQRGDSAMQRRLGDAAVARFRSEMGVDLRQLRLTDRGFVPGA